jgi:RimJ/RimL family protein N-acetyltransferase
VLRLAPRPDQEPWSGAAARTLPEAEAHPDRTPVAIVADDRPVGFFVLDVGQDMRDGLGQPTAIGLRAFFVDRRHQRRGIGRAALAALPAFIRRHFPACTGVVLTVNVDNTAALGAYLGAGFRDTGRLFQGGRLGPQHVLLLRWPD